MTLKTSIIFTTRDPKQLFISEMENNSQSQLAIIELQPDGICIAHFRIPNKNIGFVRHTFGPINICFISNGKGQRILENHDVWKIIEDNEETSSGELSGVSASSKTLELSFATMGNMSMNYRALVADVGVQDAVMLLLAIRDIVSLKEYRPDTAEIKKIQLRKRVYKSLARTTEQHFLLENGISIIHKNERVAINSARPEFECHFQLDDGREYSYDFKFGPTTDLGRRIAVLIGKNGSGKTQTLRHTAQFALGAITSGWHGNFTPSRVIGFYSGNQISKVFPRKTLKRSVSGYKVCNLAYDAGLSSTALIEALLTMIGSGEKIADMQRFEILIDSLRQARGNHPVSILHKSHGPIDISKIHLVRKEPTCISYVIGGDEHVEEPFSEFQDSIDRAKGVFGLKPNDLSSGEDAYIRFCIFAAAHTENGSLLLLDEPEVFLHPQFIDALMGSLHRILELTGSVAVVATHSAYVLRCVQEDMVHIIRGNDSHYGRELVEVQKPRMKTFGADVGLISLFVFGEDEMETTKKRALEYHSKLDQGDIAPEISLRSIVSEDLIAKIVNSDE